MARSLSFAVLRTGQYDNSSGGISYNSGGISYNSGGTVSLTGYSYPGGDLTFCTVGQNTG
jgi:hypothetical protein